MVSGAEERWHRRKGGGGVSSSHVHVGGEEVRLPGTCTEVAAPTCPVALLVLLT